MWIHFPIWHGDTSFKVFLKFELDSNRFNCKLHSLYWWLICRTYFNFFFTPDSSDTYYPDLHNITLMLHLCFSAPCVAAVISSYTIFYGLPWLLGLLIFHLERLILVRTGSSLDHKIKRFWWGKHWWQWETKLPTDADEVLGRSYIDNVEFKSISSWSLWWYWVERLFLRRIQKVEVGQCLWW